VTETFDRESVQKLRGEAASHRVKAKRADALAASLVTATAALTGKLADATDLPYTDDLLDEDGFVDEDKVRAAVDELVKRKPHLAARRPTGKIGQGAGPNAGGRILARCSAGAFAGPSMVLRSNRLLRITVRQSNVRS
jgi:hypothetical protein